MVIERLSGSSKTVFSCSDPIREEVLKYFGFASKTMWYPIDLNLFCVQNVSKCRKELGLEPNDMVGVFVGNTSPMKNFEVVRALIKALPDVRWLLALRGEKVRGLETNPNVKIFLNVPANQIPSFYGAADFSVCPSRYDPFPYVVSESLACGTPVIAPPHGASRFFLSDPPLDRLLVSGPDAIDEFISAAQEVLRNRDLYRRLVQERARPLLEEAMGPENWWTRFCSETGL